MKVIAFKTPWRTNLFNEGQLVFVQQQSGNQAFKVRGKYRGKHRWISAWFKWNDNNSGLIEFKELDIPEKHLNKIMGTNTHPKTPNSFSSS